MSDSHGSQGYNSHAASDLSSSLSTSTSNLSTISAQSQQPGGRRPIAIRDAQQRAMLQNIRDSLAHLQKSSLPSPGSDTSGASGTSTPNKDTLQNKEGTGAAKRNDNYHTAALAEIRKSLMTFKKDDAKEADIEATAKVNVKELILQICPPDSINGPQSKFGGLVGSLLVGSHSSSVRKVDKQKTEVIASSQMYATEGGGAVSPPPLPPRTRALTTPPPALPPRVSLAVTVGGGGISRSSGGQYASTAYQTGSFKEPVATRSTSGASSAPRSSSPNSVHRTNKSQTASSVPSATPPSSLEQLAEQTGLTTQQIHDILIQHSLQQQQQQQQRPPPPQPQQTQSQQPAPSYNEHYNLHNSHTVVQSPPHRDRNGPVSSHQHISQQEALQQHQQQQQQYHQTAAASQQLDGSHVENGEQLPPPHYSSTRHYTTNCNPPPPPYRTAPHHQPSPASSVTSGGSSNDYLLFNYGYSAAPNGEYRTSAYGESPSSGSSSPASLQGHPPYSSNGLGNNHHLHPGAANHHHNMLPTPIAAWEAKQQPVITHSARSQAVSRPNIQTATVPHNTSYAAPPSYTTSIHAHVGGNASRPGLTANGAGGGGNVHIKLRNHQDPQLQVTGFPSFLVTTQNAQQTNLGQIRSSGVVDPSQRPAIQFNFSTTAGPLELPHRRKGSLETRSDSPISRTTNQSPLSMMSTASTNSDLLPDRPPPPYPGISRQHHQHPAANPSKPAGGVGVFPPGSASVNNTVTPGSLESSSEPEQSETESESERRTGGGTLRCTSPKPRLRPDGEKKDEDRMWTKLRHYSPAAFKFFMEQHVENVLKQHKERVSRRIQLEREMSKVDLSEEAKNQMRKLLKQKETNYLRLKRAKMNRGMFDVIKKLGIGAFGEVSLVRKKVMDNGGDSGDLHAEQLYAMKTLKKADVIRRNQVAHVKAERDILAEAELEWVTKLYYSFQDKENLYFIMEYIPGGDLMALLIKKGIFDEQLAMFYIAELVLAVESVHKMGFIHRDVKPDNVLIDKDGHLKLTDFGLCTGFRWTHNSKYYQEGGHNRQDSMDPQEMSTDPCHCPKELPKILEKRRRKEKQRCLAHSLVGTPNYIPPEVLLRHGYTKSCDWWSVGVILYEMVVGQAPFLANTPKDTQIKVVNWKTTLHIPPESGLSWAAQNLILRLCSGPEERLGRNGAEEIKEHSFFRSIQFKDLRKQRAPYRPTIRYPTDTSNFDEVEEQEEHPPYKTDDLRQNGHFPEHAFSEFTFRRFFDDGGHARPLNLTESLSYQIQSLSLSNNNINHSAQSVSQSEERTPQNSYHEEDTRNTGGNPVYV